MEYLDGISRDTAVMNLLNCDRLLGWVGVHVALVELETGLWLLYIVHIMVYTLCRSCKYMKTKCTNKLLKTICLVIDMHDKHGCLPMVTTNVRAQSLCF
jgi:hypothetical protein